MWLAHTPCISAKADPEKMTSSYGPAGASGLTEQIPMTHTGDAHRPWESHTVRNPASWDRRARREGEVQGCRTPSPPWAGSWRTVGCKRALPFFRRKHGLEGEPGATWFFPGLDGTSWSRPGWTLKLLGTGDAHLLPLSPFWDGNVCNLCVLEAGSTSGFKGKDFAVGWTYLKSHPYPI